MCRSAMKATNCQRFLCHTFLRARSTGLHLERSGAHSSEKTCLVFPCFPLPSHSGSVSFFHHKLVKRVTLLLIGYVPSDLRGNWPAKQRVSFTLFLILPLFSLSLSLSLSLLSWPCSRVGWFGMTISQGRNADNRSELPGVAASQLTRNKAFLTD